MTDTDTIIDRLNEISADTSINWWDEIASEFDLDMDAIEAADPGYQNDVIALTDGRWFRHYAHAGTWVETDAPD